MILQLTRLIRTFFSPVELFLSVNIRLIYSNSTLLLASITIYVWSKNRVSPSLREERCPFRRQVPEVWSDEREGLLVLWTFSQVVVESLSGVTHYTSFQSGQRTQKSVHYWPFFTLSIFSCNKKKKKKSWRVSVQSSTNTLHNWMHFHTNCKQVMHVSEYKYTDRNLPKKKRKKKFTLIMVSSLTASAANLRMPSDSFSTAMRSSLCSQRKAFSSRWIFSRSQTWATKTNKHSRLNESVRFFRISMNHLRYQDLSLTLWAFVY